MRFSIILFAIIFVFLQLPNLYADTIYSWTDKNGIKKYSNTAPEEDVKNLEVTEGIPLSKTGDTVTGVGKVELSPVIEKQEVKNRTSKLNTEPEQTKTEEEKKKDERIQAEKIRLQGKIDLFEKLAVGRSLSLARKNAIIKQFRDKLDLLERSPEEYFSTSETE